MRTWIEISRSALIENIRALRGILEPGVVFCATIKANAYGHGLPCVLQVCLDEGVDHFAVDSIEEVEKIREIAGDGVTIFLLGAQSHDAYARVIRSRAIVTLSSADDVRLLAQCARNEKLPAQITIEVETGLHRLGAQEREVRAMVQEIKSCAGLIFVQSIASHFASSEDTSAQWETKRQNTIFCDAITWVQEQGITPFYQHIACSAATLLEPGMQHTMARLGIMLYGLWSSADARRQGTLGKRHAQIIPILSLKSTLVQIQDVPPGSAIGYGGSFVANRSMRIGVIPVGYYDGLDRRSGNGGWVVIKGTRCPIIGRVCMNMCMVDVGGAPPSTKVGDEVTLLGRDGLGVVTADDWAQLWGTIHYEVVTRLGGHLPRMLV